MDAAQPPIHLDLYSLNVTCEIQFCLRFSAMKNKTPKTKNTPSFLFYLFSSFFFTRNKNIFIKRVNKKMMRNPSLNTKEEKRKIIQKTTKHPNITILTLLIYISKFNQVKLIRLRMDISI